MSIDGDQSAKHEVARSRCKSLFLKLNTAKGRGVFTNATIASGTIVDICPVLVLDPKENTLHIEKTSLYHFTYNWPLPSSTPDGKAVKTQAVVFGLGSMFNHSSQHQNISWTRDLDRQLVVYKALRQIDAGEELCISYGDRLTFTDTEAADQESESESAETVLANIQLES